MRESVTGILQFEDKIFVIKRQSYLNVFPGYHSFPGGKVDESDRELESDYSNSIFSKYPSHLINALRREFLEELGVDLKLIEDNIIDIDLAGVALTPEFNPYRFKTHFFIVNISKAPTFHLDNEEIEKGYWIAPKDLLKEYEMAKILAVPPTIKLISSLTSEDNSDYPLDLSLSYNPDVEVAMIESIFGVRHFFPLSNTFPPANRTNCFIIGDSEKVVIDPGPKDRIELAKLKRSLLKIGFDKIFITHHHPDHHEFSTDLAREFNTPMLMSRWTRDKILEKWGDHYFDGVEISIVMEGDILCQSLGEEVLIYEIPGHDEGQLGLAPKNLSWFIVGDLIQTVGTVLISEKAGGDMKKYLNSLQRVIDLNPRFIIPSHGIPVGGVHKIEQTKKHRLSREDQIKNCLKENMKIEEMLSHIYPDLESNLHPYAMETILSHIKKINED